LPVQVPGNGFWARVTYSGDYSGFLSSGGWRTDVRGPGTKLYQLPVQDTIIDGFIEKGDGSGNTLTVEVFNGGIRLSKHETNTPRGMVEFHVVVTKPLMNTNLPSQTAVTVRPAPDTASVQAPSPVPPTGVWAKISYTGNYTGTIATNGMQRDVSGSGNKILQLVIASGMIESSITKEDGSAMPLSLEIYKDGERVDLGTTTRPGGSVQIQTMV
jgi:hypothetical protein